MGQPIRMTVWNEYRHEREEEAIAAIYPEGIHGCIAGFLRKAGFDTVTATLDEPENGLTEEVLSSTDVLVWWGHQHHQEVADAVVTRVYNRVQEGMGLIVLHSGHGSKIFEKLCGTKTGLLKWRAVGEKERLWVVDPAHPIAVGLPEHIDIPREEMYGEHFHIPAPDELVFISWFEGGEVFRSGCCFHRGKGKIFYFRPGHEEYPVFFQPEIQKILVNAARWAAPAGCPELVTGQITEPLEEIRSAKASVLKMHQPEADIS